jgi:uncharacterized protein YciI
MSEFVYVIRPERDPAGEESLVDAHFEYLEDLHRRGVVRYAGRCEDATFGLILFEAPDEEAARAVMHGDPAVSDGLFAAELHAFRTALS